MSCPPDSRAQSCCPDSYPPAEPGCEMPLHPDLTDDFAECPAAFLRSAADVEAISIRLGRPAFGEHLIDGILHPYSEVGNYIAEMENGARMANTLSPRVLELVHIGRREQAKRREYQGKERKER